MTCGGGCGEERQRRSQRNDNDGQADCIVALFPRCLMATARQSESVAVSCAIAATSGTSFASPSKYDDFWHSYRRRHRCCFVSSSIAYAQAVNRVLLTKHTFIHTVTQQKIQHRGIRQRRIYGTDCFNRSTIAATTRAYIHSAQWKDCVGRPVCCACKMSQNHCRLHCFSHGYW